MAGWVLDASAVIAFLNREPGFHRVAEHLPSSILSTVNLAEVVGYFTLRGFSAEDIDALLKSVPFSVHDFDAAGATGAGLLIASTKPRGLSLADRACLALAASMQLPALTADRHWPDLDLGVEVIVIR